MRYKIIKCTQYSSDEQMPKEWYEVQYLSNVKKYWYFGERVWVSFKDKKWYPGGTYYAPIRFKDEHEAREFINKCQDNIPSASTCIFRKTVWELLG